MSQLGGHFVIRKNTGALTYNTVIESHARIFARVAKAHGKKVTDFISEPEKNIMRCWKSKPIFEASKRRRGYADLNAMRRNMSIPFQCSTKNGFVSMKKFWRRDRFHICSNDLGKEPAPENDNIEEGQD